MAEVTMDNPLSPATSITVHYEKIIKDIKDCVCDLKQEFQDSGGFPIDDDFQPLQRLCSKLEYLLQTGLKSKTNLLGSKKDYWNYMYDCLYSKKHLTDGIRYVKSINELQTNLGRGRALIRFCLVHQRLADTLQQCALDVKTTSEWYHHKSVWFDRKLIFELLNILYDLNDIKFNLSTRDCDLDTSWPTFSRHSVGGLHHCSSRVSNISSSLSSILSVMDGSAPQTGIESEVAEAQAESIVPQAETHQPSPEDKIPYVTPTKPDAEASNEQQEAKKPEAKENPQEADMNKDQMEKLLKIAEHEKMATEIKLEQEKKEMEHKIINLEKEVMTLKGEAIDWQKKCTEMEIQNEMLSGKLQVKGDVAMEKEEMLRVRAEDAEKLLQDFKSDFEKSGDSKSPSQKFDMMELRGQLMVQKKRNQALEMNLKSAEMELAAKVKVDTKKTELIDLLDKKLNKQKQEIDYLFLTAQTLIREKEAQSKKLSSASEELIKLSKRYVESEKIANELRRQNNQLKAMLNSLEGKGKKLAGLAKEKVKSYTDQNKKLQEEVDDLKQEIGSSRESIETKVKSLENMLTTSCSEILVQVEKLLQKETLDEQGKKELVQIQEQIRSLEQTKLELANSLSSAEANIKSKLESHIAELTKQNTELLAQLQSLKQENQKLKQEIAASQGQGQGEVGDTKGKEALLEEIKIKNDEIEKLRAELGAIRALVLKSVGGVDQEAVSAVEVDSGDIVKILQNLLHNSTEDHSCVKTVDKDDHSSSNDDESSDRRDKVMTVLIENAQLKTMISQTVSELADVQRKLEGQQLLLEDKSHELEEAKEQVKMLQKENELLQNKLHDSSSEMSKKEEELADMRNRITDFNRILQELKEIQELAIKEKNDLYEKFKDTDMKMTDMEENFVAIMTELTNLKDENLNLMHNRDQLSSDLESAQCERSELEATLTSLRSCLEASEKIFHEMKSTIEKQKLEKGKIEQELEELKKIDAINQSKFEEELKKSIRLDQVLASKTTEFQAQKELLNERVKKLEGELEVLKTEMQEQKSKYSTIENDLLNKSKEVENWKQLLEESETKRNLISDQLREVEDKLTRVSSEKEVSEGKAKDFNFQYLSAKSVLDDKDAIIDDLQNRIKENEEKLSVVSSKLEEAEHDKVQLKEELEEARNMVKQFEAKSPKMKSALDKKEKSNEGGEKRSSQAIIVPDIQVENRNLHQQVEELLTSKDEMCRKLLDEKAALEEHIKALISETETKSRELNNLEIQYHSLENEMQNLQECCDGKSEAIQTLMENMELSRIEMEAMRSKASEVDNLKVKLQEAEHKIVEMEEDMAKKTKEWEMEMDGWENKVSTMKFQMSASEMEYEEIIKKLKTTISEHSQIKANIDNYEELVDSLNTELKQLRKEKDQAQDKAVELHKQLQNVLKENKVLARELVTTNGLLHDEKVYNAELKQQYNEQSFKCDHISKTLAECETDSKELQKKILKLVREKDFLWQKIVKLEHERQLRVTDKWMDDSEVDKCLKCSAEFSLILRKHHCRLCGRIFCHDCCSNFIMTPHSAKEERVCSECLMSYSQLESEDQSDEAENKDFLDTIEIPKKRSTLWSESSKYNSDRQASSSDDNVIADNKDDGDTQSESHSVHEANLDEARLPSMTDDNNSGLVREETSSQLPDTPSQMSDRTDSDEAYDLITTDEVMESLSEPVPDPNLDFHPTITLEQIESGVCLCPLEPWVSAGRLYAVPIFLDRTGVTVHWQFNTKPKGISFSLTYKENDFVTKSSEEVLIDPCKCNSHKEPVTGSLTARKPGIYTLLFDNTTSRFTGKEIVLTLKMMNFEEVTCT